MRHVIRNSFLVLGLLVLFSASLFPPQENLRLGKDLRGGVSLVYAVQLAPGDNANEVMSGIIDVLKNRIDPRGQFDITIVRQGQDRLEITMPAASQATRELRAAYEAALEAAAQRALTASELNRLVARPASDRGAAIDRIAGEDGTLRDAMLELAVLSDQSVGLRAELDGLPPETPVAEIDELIDLVAQAEIAFEDKREEVLATVLGVEELQTAIEQSDVQRFLAGEEGGEQEILESDRERALAALIAGHPDLEDRIRAAEAAYDEYISEREGLDDASDLERLVARSGVLNFRITVNPQGATAGTHPEEARLRSELLAEGPRGVQSDDAIWVEMADPFDALNLRRKAEADLFFEQPAAYAASQGFVLEEYGGSFYVLCWDRRGSRLTSAEGEWSVENAFRTADQIGRPAIGFEMDARGARRLGELTGDNTGENMAVILDDLLYTAPTLISRISNQGQITGQFPEQEISSLIRTLRAGSLQARLTPEPLSVNEVGPELGQDNLDRGLIAGVVSLIAVSVFMVFYYFLSGGVAVISLAANAILILGAMALSRAAFTLPGIAGLILTFGMAVDANVLIYERIREELRKGIELRIAVKQGYKKALSSIVDGNVTNLIVCFVLANVGTQEIKGFAITLGVGVVCTMFSALFISRLIFTYLVDYVKIKKLPMLPTVVPVVERTLEPKINWMGMRWGFRVISTIVVGLGVAMVIFQNREMLDAEFRGGTQVTFDLAYAEDDPSTPDVDESLARRTLTRQAVVEMLGDHIDSVRETSPESDLLELRNADVLVVNPEDDGVTSSRFSIKTYLTEKGDVEGAIASAFEGWVDQRPPLVFTGSGQPRPSDDVVIPITSSRMADVLGNPEYRGDVADFRGGVAILFEDLSPAPSLEEIEARIANTRTADSYSATLSRTTELRLLRGDPSAVEAAVLLVTDPRLDYASAPETWERELADLEWEIVREALTTSQSLASVQNFSAVIAETFQARAIVAVVLSLLLILVYIWARFGSVRYSLAAIVCLVHDVLTCVGLIALAEIVYEFEGLQSIASTLLIEPFKIDLNLVAAILTIIGYSLNDTIIILDRIRENRGKLSFASTQVVNDSINQTISRTVITSGTTLIATLILYIEGGQGVRAFSFALLIGIMVGTYSSIAVAAPLVWSGRDRLNPKPEPKGSDGSSR